MSRSGGGVTSLSDEAFEAPAGDKSLYLLIVIVCVSVVTFICSALGQFCSRRLQDKSVRAARQHCVRQAGAGHCQCMLTTDCYQPQQLPHCHACCRPSFEPPRHEPPILHQVEPQEYRRQSGNQRRIYERSGVNSRNISRSNVSRLTDSGTFRRLGIGQDRSSSALQPLARHLENKALSPIHQTPPHQSSLDGLGVVENGANKEEGSVVAEGEMKDPLPHTTQIRRLAERRPSPYRQAIFHPPPPPPPPMSDPREPMASSRSTQTDVYTTFLKSTHEQSSRQLSQAKSNPHDYDRIASRHKLLRANRSEPSILITTQAEVELPSAPTAIDEKVDNGEQNITHREDEEELNESRPMMTADAEAAAAPLYQELGDPGLTSPNLPLLRVHDGLGFYTDIDLEEHPDETGTIINQLPNRSEAGKTPTVPIAKSSSVPNAKSSSFPTVPMMDPYRRMSDNFFNCPPDCCHACGQVKKPQTEGPSGQHHHFMQGAKIDPTKGTANSLSMQQLTVGSMFEIKAKADTGTKRRKLLEVDTEPVMSASSDKRRRFHKLIQENEMSSRQSSVASGENFRPRVESLQLTDDMWDNEGMPNEMDQIRADCSENLDLIQIDPSYSEGHSYRQTNL